MKKSKRMLAVLLALALVLSMNVVAFSVNAAEDDIVLNGDETGASSMIGDFSYYDDWYGYDYTGFVTLKDADLTAYKYLQITYTGDVSFLRFELEKVGMKPPVKSAATWFDATQAAHLVTVDETPISTIVAEPTTIVIDLAASGIDLTKGYDGLHMHYGDDAVASQGFVISDARLMTTAPTPVEPVDPELISITGTEEAIGSANTFTYTVIAPKAYQQVRIMAQKDGGEKFLLTYDNTPEAVGDGTYKYVLTTQRLKDEGTYTITASARETAQDAYNKAWDISMETTVKAYNLDSIDGPATIAAGKTATYTVTSDIAYQQVRIMSNGALLGYCNTPVQQADGSYLYTITTQKLKTAGTATVTATARLTASSGFRADTAISMDTVVE